MVVQTGTKIDYVFGVSLFHSLKILFTKINVFQLGASDIIAANFPGLIVN